MTFHAPKVGLAIAPGRFHAGRVVVADIGLEHDADRGAPRNARAPRRRSRVAASATRSTRSGSVLVVGGQPGMTGAACLTALAALRADAGYVTLAVPEESLAAAEVLALEPVKLAWTDDDAVETIARRCRARDCARHRPWPRAKPRSARALVRSLLERVDLPAVVDADALFELEPVERSAPTVLTPHAGELGRLLGRDSEWVGAHRLEAAREVAERFQAIVLLKGADTIVAAPDGTAVVCDLGPPSLATAGTGDVLTGVVGAFLAKGVDAMTAAAAACCRARARRRRCSAPGRARRERPPAVPARRARPLTRRQFLAARDRSLYTP